MKILLKIIFLSLILNACTRIDTKAPVVFNHKKADYNRASSVPIIDADGDLHLKKESHLEETHLVSDQEDVDINRSQILKNKPDEYRDVRANDSKMNKDVLINKKDELINKNQTPDNQAVSSSNDEFEDLDISVELAKLEENEDRSQKHKPQSNTDKVKESENFSDDDYIKIPNKDTSGVAGNVEGNDKNNPQNIDIKSSSVQTKEISKPAFIRPVEGKIILAFGQKSGSSVNQGINIAAPAGTKVKSTAAGDVIYADYDATFGNLVIIKLTGKNVVAAYAHLKDISVAKGSKIAQGAVIGHVGATGKVDKSQLYFAIREGKKSVDPLKYVKY